MEPKLGLMTYFDEYTTVFDERMMGRTAPKPSRRHIHELLLNAKALLQEHGWATGSLRTHDGRVCGAGAILLARYGHIPKMLTHEDRCILTRCGLAMGIGPSIPAWNDYVTYKEVIAAFDHGIEATSPGSPDKAAAAALVRAWKNYQEPQKPEYTKNPCSFVDITFTLDLTKDKELVAA